MYQYRSTGWRVYMSTIDRLTCQPIKLLNRRPINLSTRRRVHLSTRRPGNQSTCQLFNLLSCLYISVLFFFILYLPKHKYYLSILLWIKITITKINFNLLKELPSTRHYWNKISVHCLFKFQLRFQGRKRGILFFMM